jgi:hypothetical protein
MVGGEPAVEEGTGVAGVYVGRTPPVPVYVTNAMLEFEVGKTPVIAVAVTPGNAPENTGFVVNVTGVVTGVWPGHALIGNPEGSARSVNAAVVAPKTCSPSLVVAIRLVVAAITPASG